MNCLREQRETATFTWQIESVQGPSTQSDPSEAPSKSSMGRQREGKQLGSFSAMQQGALASLVLRSLISPLTRMSCQMLSRCHGCIQSMFLGSAKASAHQFHKFAPSRSPQRNCPDAWVVWLQSLQATFKPRLEPCSQGSLEKADAERAPALRRKALGTWLGPRGKSFQRVGDAALGLRVSAFWEIFSLGSRMGHKARPQGCVPKPEDPNAAAPSSSLCPSSGP